MSMKLYQISQAIEQVSDEFDDRVAMGDFTDPSTGLPMEPEQMLDRMIHAIDELEMESEEKVLEIACLVKSLKAEGLAYKEEEQRLAARRKTIERKAEWLAGYIAQHVTEGKKIESPRARVSWRRSERLKLLIEPESLPERYQNVTIKADLTTLKRAVKADPSAFTGMAEIESHQNIQIS